MARQVWMSIIFPSYILTLVSVVCRPSCIYFLVFGPIIRWQLTCLFLRDIRVLSNSHWFRVQIAFSEIGYCVPCHHKNEPTWRHINYKVYHIGHCLPKELYQVKRDWWRRRHRNGWIYGLISSRIYHVGKLMGVGQVAKAVTRSQNVKVLER